MELTAILPAVATLTTAFIAGFVAFVSSVLSKEQKTSEFRYAWLNAVLDDIAKFTGAAESISAAASSHARTEGKDKLQQFWVAAEPQVRELLAAYYRARIRLYPKEHQLVLEALERLQALLLKGVPEPTQVDPLVREIVRVSHEALKEEWGRVKRGETTFRVTKYGSLAVFSIAIIIIVAIASFKALGYLQ